MVDKREIEGTSERALDRGDPIGLGVFDVAADDDRPYLGDPEVVDGLVRGMCSRAMEAGLSDGDVVGKVSAIVEDVAGVFMGRSPGYRGMPFNSPEQLGRWVNETLGTAEAEDRSVEMLLWSTLAQVMDARASFVSGAKSEDDVRFQTDAAIEDACRVLIGLPFDAAIDDEAA